MKARNEELCKCRDPWTNHEAFVWAPPANGEQHWPQIVKEEDEAIRVRDTS